MPLSRRAQPFNHPEWVFEIKHDGFRALAYVKAGQCQLVSRKGYVYKRFVPLAEQIARSLKARDAVLDGEIVCLDGSGKSQFKSLIGIGLATASAILTVCYPDRFTIIDRRVLERLKLLPSKPKHKHNPNTYTADNWTSEGYLNEFLPEVEKRSKQWRCQLRTADRALWGLSVCEDVKRIIASS